ncbi:MAG: fatty acid CoA ligase family protein [Desulfuromonadales bacterium]|nr:fatty acid CoA ligase family protein [Desulfuromonadales bacterium]
MTPVNVAAHLPAMAQQQPDAPALYIPRSARPRQRDDYRAYSFAELDRQSSRMAAALRTYGIDRGVRTVLMVPPGFDFFALTFALFKIGAVPVLVDPGLGLQNLKGCLHTAEPQAFIGIPKAHLARLLFGWGRPTLRRLVTVGRRCGWGGTSLAHLLARSGANTEYPVADTAADEMAAILFTSGSTGAPKGAVYSHGNFAAQVELLREVYAIRPGEIDLPTFPLFALFAPALGMTSVVPVMDFTRPALVDPDNILSAVELFQVTSMFGSPALINRVGRHGAAHGVHLPSLRRVISAGAPVPAAVLERFTGMLAPGVELFTPYGATEALPVCSIGSAEILGETRAATDRGQGVCIGRPVPGVDLAIIAIDDGPIAHWRPELVQADGKVGEIVVRGPQTTHSYVNRPEATALAKIIDAETGTFYHRMGDLGYRDNVGRIWFCGRKAHRVETAAGTLFTICCEAVFNTHPEVFRTALVGVGPPGRQRPVLCVELEAGVAPAACARIGRELLAIGAANPVTTPIETLLFHPAFPVDIRHNAKIFREKLALWAAEKLA